MKKSREYFRDKAVLITGASSGIGEELARQLGRCGAKLTLVSRRTPLLHALADGIASSGTERPLVVDGDVTRDGEMERAIVESVQRWGKLDVVVANAGFGVVGALTTLTLDDYRRQFETNVFGVLRTIYAALPEIEKARGHIVIIGSVAGWTATAGTSPYAMSKFALRALADSITPELRATGVKVTLISPGFVVSNIRRVDNQGAFRATEGSNPRVACGQHRPGGTPDSEGGRQGQAGADRHRARKNHRCPAAFRTVADSRRWCKTDGEAHGIGDLNKN